MDQYLAKTKIGLMRMAKKFKDSSKRNTKNTRLTKLVVRTKTYKRIPTDKRSIVNAHSIEITAEKKGKRKVQGVPQSQTAALPRNQEEEEIDKTKKHESNKRTKSTKISSLFPQRGNRNA